MDRNFGPDKSWGEMSQSEKQAYIIRNRQRGEFERLIGNGQVMFLDELTPLLDDNDPHRRCVYAGNILEKQV